MLVQLSTVMFKISNWYFHNDSCTFNLIDILGISVIWAN